jgi:hypothetical protein
MTYIADDFPGELLPIELEVFENPLDNYDERYELATSRVDQLVAQLGQALQDAMAADFSSAFATVCTFTETPTYGLDGFPLIVPTPPDLEGMIYIPPEFVGNVPVLNDVVVGVDDPPPFNVPDPAVVIPDAPAVTWPAFNIDAPSLLSVDVPTAPDYDVAPLNVEEPTEIEVNIPSRPDYAVPPMNIDEPQEISVTVPDAPDYAVPPLAVSEPTEVDVNIPARPDVTVPTMNIETPQEIEVGIPEDLDYEVPALTVPEPTEVAVNIPPRPDYTVPPMNIDEPTELSVDIPPVPDYQVPSLNVQEPTEAPVSIPNAPDYEVPSLNVDAPQEISLEIPAVPSYELPPIPTLTEVTIPSIPEFNEPAFEGTPPTIDITPPVLDFSWSEDPYSSDMRDLLDERVRSNIVTGGSGLGPEVEQAIYDRAIARQEDELDQQLLEATSFWASRGFSMPAGILNGTVLEARNKIAQTREDLNRDILIQESRLAQENTHFMYQRGVEMERLYTEHANQVQARSLDAAKYVVTAGIQVYQAKVECYKAQVQMYRIRPTHRFSRPGSVRRSPALNDTAL